MPGSRKHNGRGARDVTRCSYVEGGRRCTRNGKPDTNPPLCAVHLVVFAEVGRPPARGQSAVADVLDDLLSGQRVTTDRLRDAAQEFMGNWGIGGGIAQGYYPDIDDDTPGASSPPPGFHPPHGFRPPPGWPFVEAPDPLELERIEACRRARQVLGFASEPLTHEMIQKRQRELAKRHHPDLGGKVERMQEINAAVDVLMESLTKRRKST